VEHPPLPGLWNRFERIFKWRRTVNGGSASDELVEILKESYRDVSRLAAQVSNHAARAPYPGVAERLRRIAEEKQSSANLIRARLIAAHQTLGEVALDIKSAGNHWERMAQDLSDHTSLETRLLERAARLDERAPDAADLLREIVRSNNPHLKVFMDLIARADPQAQQT
jgi:hypothetical protein